jgi:hypothetical protein
MMQKRPFCEGFLRNRQAHKGIFPLITADLGSYFDRKYRLGTLSNGGTARPQDSNISLMFESMSVSLRCICGAVPAQETFGRHGLFYALNNSS